MPDYQLPASVALAAVAAISALFNLANSKQEGNIKLKGPEGEQEHDPFDVTTPEDVAPGEPIDGPQFWSWVCTRTPLPPYTPHLTFRFREHRSVSSSFSFFSTLLPFSFSKLFRSDGPPWPSNQKMLSFPY